MTQIDQIYAIIFKFFYFNLFSFYNNYNQLDFFFPIELKENLIKTLNFFNISFNELTNDLIEIYFFNNTQILIPSSYKGIFIINNLYRMYSFQYFPITILDYYTKTPKFSFPILLSSKLVKKLPINSEEIQAFFNSLKAITDFNYLGNFNLDDIFYDTNNNYYLILNFECFEPKNPLIEVRLDNLLNENKNIYFLNNQPLNSNDFYNFRNMGMI